MRSFGLDYDRALLLLVGEGFFDFFSYILESVRSLLTECDIVFIDEHAPSRDHVLGTIFEVVFTINGRGGHLCHMTKP